MRAATYTPIPDGGANITACPFIAVHGNVHSAVVYVCVYSCITSLYVYICVCVCGNMLAYVLILLTRESNKGPSN